MFDLHSHILPAVDDGAKTLQESLKMLAMSQDDGVQGIIMTPHLHPSDPGLDQGRFERAFSLLKQAMVEHGLTIKIKQAAEVRLCPEIIPLTAEGKLPVLGRYQGKPVALIEFHPVHIMPETELVMRQLIKLGIQPLIAHPERNTRFLQDATVIQPFLDMGCLLQVNAGSLLGHFRQEPRDRAMRLVKEGKVHVVASDCHNTHKRAPCLKDAYRHIAMLYGESRADQLLITHPGEIFSS